MTRAHLPDVAERLDTAVRGRHAPADDRRLARLHDASRREPVRELDRERSLHGLPVRRARRLRRHALSHAPRPRSPRRDRALERRVSARSSRHAALRPVASIGSSAGDGWYEWPLSQAGAEHDRGAAAAGGVVPFIERFPCPPQSAPSACSREEVETMMNLSMCACYAPNLEPFRCCTATCTSTSRRASSSPTRGRSVLSWDPVACVDRHVDSRAVPPLDPPSGRHGGRVRAPSRAPAARQEAPWHGVAHVIDEYPGSTRPSLAHGRARAADGRRHAEVSACPRSRSPTSSVV